MPKNLPDHWTSSFHLPNFVHGTHFPKPRIGVCNASLAHQVLVGDNLESQVSIGRRHSFCEWYFKHGIENLGGLVLFLINLGTKPMVLSALLYKELY